MLRITLRNAGLESWLAFVEHYSVLETRHRLIISFAPDKPIIHSPHEKVVLFSHEFKEAFTTSPIGVVHHFTKSITVIAVAVDMSTRVNFHDSDSLAHVPSMDPVTRRTCSMNRGDRANAINV